MRRRIVFASVWLGLLGCTTTKSIRPSEVARLDGYDVQRFTEPVLETIGGDRVRVAADWCLERGEPDLGRRLRKTIHTTPTSVATRSVSASLQGELEAQGWLPPDERHDLFDETRLAVASRLAALIAARASTA